LSEINHQDNPTKPRQLLTKQAITSSSSSMKSKIGNDSWTSIKPSPQQQQTSNEMMLINKEFQSSSSLHETTMKIANEYCEPTTTVVNNELNSISLMEKQPKYSPNHKYQQNHLPSTPCHRSSDDILMMSESSLKSNNNNNNNLNQSRIYENVQNRSQSSNHYHHKHNNHHHHHHHHIFPDPARKLTKDSGYESSSSTLVSVARGSTTTISQRQQQQNHHHHHSSMINMISTSGGYGILLNNRSNDNHRNIGNQMMIINDDHSKSDSIDSNLSHKSLPENHLNIEKRSIHCQLPVINQHCDQQSIKMKTNFKSNDYIQHWSYDLYPKMRQIQKRAVYEFYLRQKEKKKNRINNKQQENEEEETGENCIIKNSQYQLSSCSSLSSSSLLNEMQTSTSYVNNNNNKNQDNNNIIKFKIRRHKNRLLSRLNLLRMESNRIGKDLLIFEKRIGQFILKILAKSNKLPSSSSNDATSSQQHDQDTDRNSTPNNVSVVVKPRPSILDKNFVKQIQTLRINNNVVQSETTTAVNKPKYMKIIDFEFNFIQQQSSDTSSWLLPDLNPTTLSNSTSNNGPSSSSSKQGIFGGGGGGASIGGCGQSFSIVSAVGLDGVGKSSLLNSLAQFNVFETRKMMSEKNRETPLNHVTNGIDMHITCERLFLLDTQPLLIVGFDIGETENFAFIYSLQMLTFLLSISDHLIIVMDSFCLDVNLFKLLATSLMMVGDALMAKTNLIIYFRTTTSKSTTNNDLEQQRRSSSSSYTMAMNFETKFRRFIETILGPNVQMDFIHNDEQRLINKVLRPPNSRSLVNLEQSCASINYHSEYQWFQSVQKFWDTSIRKSTLFADYARYLP
ncbi:smg-9, nonsense mediated mRNA decay factor, partial [Dermatophagoides pteronyssinus]